MTTTSAAIPPESEADYMAAILDLAHALGWRTYHPHDSRRSAAGWPDVTLCHPVQRRLVFAELKSAHGQLSREQHLWLAALSGCRGIELYVWRAGTDSLASIAAILRGGS